MALFFDAYLQDFAYLGHSYVAPGAAERYVKGSVAIPCIFTMPVVSPVHTLLAQNVEMLLWKKEQRTYF